MDETRSTRRSPTRVVGLRLAALAVAVAVALVVIVSRHRRPVDLGLRDERCDELFTGLNGEIANEIDAVLRGRETACGTTDGAAAVVDCVLFRHAGERNPYDRNESAYTRAEELSSFHSLCRVGLEPLGTNAVAIAQWTRADGDAPRSFRIVIEDRE